MKIFYISLSSPGFSQTSWDGLEKPVGTVKTANFEACLELAEEYGLTHYNRGFRTCTPAKVWIARRFTYLKGRGEPAK